MPQYKGFSTVGANQPRTTNATPGVDGGYGSLMQPILTGKKFTLVDEKLVIQDFVNALNIKQGEKVGQPGYGTTMWSLVFDPNTFELQSQVETEIKRVAGLDPRMILNYVKAYPQDNGILVEVEMAVQPFNNATTINLFINTDTSQAYIQ